MTYQLEIRVHELASSNYILIYDPKTYNYLKKDGRWVTVLMGDSIPMDCRLSVDDIVAMTAGPYHLAPENK